MDLASRARGLLLGLAVGDALGLPREGLPPRRAARLFGTAPRHAFWLGRGVVSDDTEHAFMTAQALLATRADPSRFVRSLAWRLRGWIVSLPPGVGWATLRACLRLCLGASPSRSGRNSAGNGALVRAPVLGFAIRDPVARRALVDASTRITHIHPLAIEAARAVAELAAAVRDGTSDPAALLERAGEPLCDDAWTPPMDRVARGLAAGAEPGEWAAAEGLTAGVSGFVLHTLPAALFAWLRAPHDYRATVTTALALGGDADTVAAIAGSLAGATAGVPEDLVHGLADAPLTVHRLSLAAERLASLVRDEAVTPVPMPWRAVAPARNLLVLAVAVAHALRRTLPPY